MEATSLRHVKPERQRWFRVACCPTNIARTLASLGHYIYAYDENTIYINMFISSSLNIPLSGQNVTLQMTADLLQSGDVTIVVKSPGNVKLNLAIRLPDYAEAPEFSIDNGSIEPDAVKGYAMIKALSGDFTVTMKLHVKPRWVAADPRVWANTGKVALMKGPFVYCLEETDNRKNLASVYVDPEGIVEEHSSDDLPDGLPVLIYQGYRLSDENWKGNRLYQKAEFRTEPVTLKAVPYAIWGNRKPGEMVVWQKAIIR